MNDGIFIWITICTILVTICTILAIAFAIIELFSDGGSD